MYVYLAYFLLLGHVLLGALQSETNPILTVTLLAGATMVIILHILAAQKENRLDTAYREVCDVADIPDSRATVVNVGGERVAVFRYGSRISAVSSVCRHQNGPLGEGKIIDGCITCPWHGYQYRPEDGCSPPPFTDKIPTYRTEIRDGKVWLDPVPLPPGTYVEPSEIVAK